MLPPGWMIEEERRRRDEERERRWEPVPLHAPSPVAPERSRRERRDEQTSNGSTVVIIDMNDYSETRI